MQTTLLGLAIAFILALLAALIGPFFVDWNQFRTQFEAEASHVIGVPVRVVGALDARLLPTPTLRLRQVSFGGANHLGKLRADRFDVEFSLGDLMRGEWRATELTIGGMAADIGLDAKGKLDLPSASGTFNLAGLSIDHLNLTGRAALHDAASRSTLELSDIVFSGDVRSLAGSLRGDGAVSVKGARYPFRVLSSQDPGSGGLRMHLTIEPGERSVGADVEGLISFADRVPHFDGAATLSSPPQPKEAAAGKSGAAEPARAPWRITTRVSADVGSAKLDGLEVGFGGEERALKFTGNGELRFGASPQLRAQLSARQLDADKLLGTDDKASPAPAARALPGLRAWLAQLPTLPLPATIQFSTDQIMLAGRPVQNFAATLSDDTTAWSLEKVDLRAPGATRVSFKTIGIPTSIASGFMGALDLESSDPDALVAWLQGRSDTSYRSQRPLRLRGDVSIAPDLVKIDGLKADMEGSAVEGRLALLTPFRGSTRFEAALKGERLDLDAATALARSLTGPSGDLPDEANIALDIGRAVWNGQEFRPFNARLAYDAASVVVDQLKFAQGAVSSEASARFDRNDGTGRLALNASAASLKGIAATLQPLAPTLATRLEAAAGAPGPARLKLALDLTKDAVSAERVQAKAVVEFEGPQLRATTMLSAKPQLNALRDFDLDALKRTDIGADTRLAAEQGAPVLALLGLDRTAAAGAGQVQFEGNAGGSWRSPLKISAKLWGGGLDGDVQGTVDPWQDAAKANLNVRVRSANLAPLLGLKPQDSAAQNVRLFGRLGLSGSRLTLDDIDSIAGGARLRGRLALTLDDDRQVDGEIGLDALDLPAIFALGIGAAGHDAAEPLTPGLTKGWRGRVSFQALSGTLPGGLELRPVSGAIKSDGRTLALDGLTAKLGGGDVTATLDARPTANGLSLSSRVELSNVDGNALRYRGLKMPPGRVAAQMTLATEGRSVQALTSALTGNGTVTLESMAIPGLDPRAFEAALRAADSGQVGDDARLRQVVEPALASGALGVASAQIPFIIRDGRLRVSATTLEAQAARAIVSGGYDIPADQADIRASLSATNLANTNSQPELSLFAVGTPDGLSRSVDVTSLSSWLAVRAIDRETRRLDAIARGEPPPSYPSSTASLPESGAPASPDVPLPGRDPRRPDPRAKARPPVLPSPPLAAPPAANPPPATVPSVATTQQATPLPPPVEVKPAPGGAVLGKPRQPRVPMVLTPLTPLPGSP